MIGRRVAYFSAGDLFTTATVAGCSVTGSGSSSPSVSSTVSTDPSQTLSFPFELDATPYMASPCDVLSPELLESRGYPADGKELEETGPGGQGLVDLTDPSCSWGAENATHAQVVTVALSDHASEGIEAAWERVRERHRSGVLQLWEELDVNGYPTAYYALRDNRDRGDCAMMIAVSRSDLVTVSAGPYMNDPGQACSDVLDFVADSIGYLNEGA